MQIIRDEVIELGSIGKIPNENESIPDGILERYEELLSSLKYPLNLEEAKIIAKIFPETACFGLEWTIVHLLEKSENWPSIAIEHVRSIKWKDELKDRIKRQIGDST